MSSWRIHIFILLCLIHFNSSLVFGQEKEYFTIITGSYKVAENAKSDFYVLQKLINDQQKDSLRIELVGGYHTLRVGKFEREVEALKLLKIVEPQFEQATVLSAYVKPDRIVFGNKQPKVSKLENEPPLPPKQLTKKNSSSSSQSRQITPRIKKKIINIENKYASLVTEPGLRPKQFYTIQLGSFSQQEFAVTEYDRIQRIVGEDHNDGLRIEKIQNFFTVRLGKFKTLAKLGELHDLLKIKNVSNKAIKAYIRTDRVVKSIAPSLDNKDAPQKLLQSKVADTSPKRLRPAILQIRPKTLFNKKRKRIKSKGQQADFVEIKPSPGEKEYFTVQIGSFTESPLALIEYEHLVAGFSSENISHLRIEFIKGFFAVRVGKFTSRDDAEKLRKIFVKKFPQSSILYAYILSERIQKSYQPIQENFIAKGAQEKESATISKDIIAGEIDDNQIDSIISDENDLGTVDELAEEVSNLSDEEDPPEQKDIEDSLAENDESEMVDEEIQEVDSADDQLDLSVDEAEIADDSQALVDIPNEDKDLSDVLEEEPEFSFEVITILKKDDNGDDIRMPSALFYDNFSDELYMVNGINNRVIIYGPDYFAQDSLGMGRSIDSPLSGYIDSNGNILISQSGSSTTSPRITILNSAFLPEREITLGDIPDGEKFIPQKIAMTKNNTIYLTGLNTEKALVLDSKGKFIKWFEIAVDKRGNYVYSNMEDDQKKTTIKDVKIDSLGNLFFLSEKTSKVYVFDAEEKFLFSFGDKGGSEGKMSRPRGIALDEKQRCIYLVDYMRHTVLIYDYTGKFRHEFGGRGWGAEWFNYPVDVVVGSHGQVIVADFFNQRAQVFELKFKHQFPERPDEMWKATQ